MADVLAFFSGAAILNNAGFYRHYHLAHHRYTQDPARDPELVTSGTPQDVGPVFVSVSSIPFLMLQCATSSCSPWLSRQCRLHPSFGVAGGAALGPLAAGASMRRWSWARSRSTPTVPAVGVVHPAADRPAVPTALPDVRAHALPNSDDGFANTRTTLSDPIVRFLMWNLPYHAEHHLFPNIAFHDLPEAHRHLRPHLKYVASELCEIQPRDHPNPSHENYDRRHLQLRRPRAAARRHAQGARIVYKTFGTLSPQRDNVIVYPTSYSAHHTDIEWLVSPEHCLDPSRYFIVIPNMFTNGLRPRRRTRPRVGVIPEVTTYATSPSSAVC